MTTKPSIDLGPSLVSSPTGRLRAAALVSPSAAIVRARAMPGEPAPVFSRALEQHQILRATLQYFGVETWVMPPADDPYAAAAADAAIVFETGAAIARPTSMARRAEADRMRTEFARIGVNVLATVAAPGLFDGSDLLLAAGTAFVGVGARGNELGREQISAIAVAQGYRVVRVRLAADVPSLRAVASAVASDTVVIAHDRLDASAFAGFATIVLERGEDFAAGVLCIGERHVVADARYRTALSQMRKERIVVEAIDLYDFTKAGLTASQLVLPLQRT
jgi:N-dimethylarginine dimethylaminohydrolase